MAKRLRFTIDGVVYHAVLRNSALAESVSAMCPFTLECTRSNGYEYYSVLPEKAETTDCPSTMKGRRNRLYYFKGWNALSLVFRDCDTAPYQIHHIGDFEEDVSAALEIMGKRIRILCELEKGD